ncbi:MAG: C39 family peptidase [Phycisphaerales bacterium]|nr:C39 family peptidase [Phycisphaerales bacterium]
MANKRNSRSAQASNQSAQSGTERSGVVLPVHILPQPDDETCGPTCLHAVYRYWGEDLELEEVIDSARSLNVAGAGRGTLAVMLGIDALTRGYRATLYTFNLHVFDPTWFGPDGSAADDQLAAKLRAQAEAKSVDDPRFRVATESYLEFLKSGGAICFRDLTSRLISGSIRRGTPVLTGLSATYLYRCAREFGPNDDYDDVRGAPAGHFVVLHGYDPEGRRVTIADPLEDNPGFESQQYVVPMGRLVPAIMLGVLTYDANLLIIEPADGSKKVQASQ